MHSAEQTVGEVEWREAVWVVDVVGLLCWERRAVLPCFEVLQRSALLQVVGVGHSEHHERLEVVRVDRD